MLNPLVPDKRAGESSHAYIMRSFREWPEKRARANFATGRSEAAAALRRRRRAAREAGDVRAANAGLVKKPYLSAHPEGRLVELFLPNIPQPAPTKRGQVEGMSAKSRRRLLALLHTIRRTAALPVMVTLTFPEEIHASGHCAKACLRAFAKRMRRTHPEWCALWRLEAHPELSAKLGRMHPHLHLLTWGAWYDLAALSEAWSACVWEVLGIDPCLSDDDGRLVREKHASAGTNCERVKKWAGVSYCAKRYIAKEAEYPTGKCGRVWGWAWRKDLPVSTEDRRELSVREVGGIVDRVREWMDARGIESEYLVRQFYSDNPAALAAWLLTGEGRCPDPPPKRKGQKKPCVQSS